jgi:hypothetical protein
VKGGSDSGQWAGGNICQRVFNASNVVDGRWGRPGASLAHGEAFKEPKGNGGGALASHTGCPSDGR